MGYNILIVDDSNIVRRVIKKTFGMTEIPVASFLEAENGKVGLELLEANSVDLILLDINMPVMNGVEFVEKIQNTPAGKIPIIVVSTEGSGERVGALRQAGVREYLRKPVTPESLVASIHAVLGDRHERK
jgi:two-component system, chemotaxis family, chemotaxis protein CheY